MRPSFTPTVDAMCEISGASPSKLMVQLHRPDTARSITSFSLPGGGAFIDRFDTVVDGSAPTIRLEPRRRGSSACFSLPGGGAFIDWLNATVDGSALTIRSIPRRRDSSASLCLPGGGTFIDCLDVTVDGSALTMRPVSRRRDSSSPTLCERGMR
jgi:hypothetical protein